MANHRCHPADLHAFAFEDELNRDEGALGVKDYVGKPLCDEGTQGFMTYGKKWFSAECGIVFVHALHDCLEWYGNPPPQLRHCSSTPTGPSRCLDVRRSRRSLNMMRARRGKCQPVSCRRLHEMEGCKENDRDTDEVWFMQKGRDQKRRRSPTPRRRRIPARGRVHFEPSQRQYRHSSWMRADDQLDGVQFTSTQCTADATL